MEDERKNELGLSEDDLANAKQVMDDLIDIVVKFNGSEEPGELEWAELKAVLDFANFIVSGIVYSNGLDLTAIDASIHIMDDDEDDDGVE